MLQELLDKFAPPNSELAMRCKEQPSFLRWLEALCTELLNAYTTLSQEHSSEFERRLMRWVKNPGGDYVSFIGEMIVAQRLVRHNVSHRFVPESDRRTPDLELLIDNDRVYFEIATISEDIYRQFAEKVAKRLDTLLPDYKIRLMPLYLRSHDSDTLVEAVTQRIQDEINANQPKLSPITCKVNSSTFNG